MLWIALLAFFLAALFALLIIVTTRGGIIQRAPQSLFITGGLQASNRRK